MSLSSRTWLSSRFGAYPENRVSQIPGVASLLVHERDRVHSMGICGKAQSPRSGGDLRILRNSQTVTEIYLQACRKGDYLSCHLWELGPIICSGISLNWGSSRCNRFNKTCPSVISSRKRSVNIPHGSLSCFPWGALFLTHQQVLPSQGARAQAAGMGAVVFQLWSCFAVIEGKNQELHQRAISTHKACYFGPLQPHGER